MKRLLGLQSLSGIVYAITKIPVELIREIVDAKVVNELDRCSKDAQDMLLTYLDRMKPGHAFLGTTNLEVVEASL